MPLISILGYFKTNRRLIMATKSKRVLSFLLTMVMLLSLSSVFCFTTAFAETDGEWQYTVNGSYAEITGYIGTDAAITVPSKVGGKAVDKVTNLCSNNFRAKVTSITFSSGIKTIGAGAFTDYTALEKVVFPDTLVNIGTRAFYGCIKLTGITLPNSVTTIGESAFAGCTSLISANLTSKITVIPTKLFDACSKLSTLTLPLYITEIGDHAFSGCSMLPSVTIPDTVKVIGSSAFNSCSSLTRVNLPYELKQIKDLAFANCRSLPTIFIPNKIKNIEEEAFKNCSSLKEVYISPSCSVIKDGIFNGCTKLEKVVFGGEYVNITGIFDVATNPTVYYPSKYATSWKDYVQSPKQSYAVTSSIDISGNLKPTVGEKTTLKITINPKSSAFSDVFSITSSNTSVASVSPDGILTAKSAGVTTITVTGINGTTAVKDITVVPAKPGKPTATPKSTSSIELKWKDYGVTGYNIYRSTSKTGTYKKIDSVLGTSYTNKGLTKGKTYYYKITAYINANGKTIESEKSLYVSVKVSAPTPATITAKKSKSGVAAISWSKSVGATGYEVYMATSKNGKFSKISTITSASTLTLKKSGLKKGKTYYFKVRSYVTVNGKKVYSPYTKVVSVKV